MPRVTFSSLLMAGFMLTVSTVALADGGDVQHGKAVFTADGCYECHGTVGQGGAAGATLTPHVMPADKIAAYVRNPHGVMPPYSPKVLSDADIADIAAYLKSLPVPKPADQIPALAAP